MPETDQRDFDEELMQTVVARRERHRLREDEAVLLLVELFRIHQSHWDEIRRRELPSFEESWRPATNNIFSLGMGWCANWSGRDCCTRCSWKRSRGPRTRWRTCESNS